MKEKIHIEYSAFEIGSILGARLVGDEEAIVSGTEFIERACESDLAFVGSSKNSKRIGSSKARVIIAPTDIADSVQEYPGRTFLFVDEPETAFLSIAQRLAPARLATAHGVSPQAFVAGSAAIGHNTTIHPFAHIGEDVSIGEDCEIGPGVSIGDGCQIGDSVRIDANAVVYANSKLGSDIVINANAVIGSEGFGYQTRNGRHTRLPHVGNVIIEDDVEIGACTTIDRAKIGSTVIGSGTRIDNSVQIAHNCQIGQHNLLVSQCGIAGSAVTGDYVVIAGQVGISDHVTLGDGAIVGAKSGVHRDMPGGQTYLGSPATPVREQTRMLMSMKRSPQLRKTVKELETQMKALQGQLATLQASAEDDNCTERDAA